MATAHLTSSTAVHHGASPELALVLAATRKDRSPREVSELLATSLDWARLTRIAVASRATPDVWKLVAGAPDLPVEAGELQAIAVIDEFRSYHIKGLVGRITAQLRDAGIEILVLKGAALLVGAVTPPVRRTMSDIDILVITGSPEAAWQACRANGWSLVDAEWTEELYRSHHHLPPLNDPDGIRIGLEIHRSLMSGVQSLGVDLGALLDRSHAVSVDGVLVRVPSVEDLLLHNCLHFAWANKLQRSAWRAFSDAHSISGDPTFDWSRFVAIMPSERARRCAYWTLRLARLLAGLEVPPEVLHSLDHRDGGPVSTLLERHFSRQLLEDETGGAPAERVRRWLWLTAMRGTGPDDLEQAWELGALDLPGEGSRTSRTRRGALSAAWSTAAYAVRLLNRG